MTNKIFKNYQEILDATQGHQVTAQELINGRTYINGEGWTDIILSDQFRDDVCNDISQILEGQYKTRAAVRNSLKYGKPQHWGLKRILLENYGSPRLSYCAGQDYTSEIRTIRTALK